jgi:hypothetical protein
LKTAREMYQVTYEGKSIRIIVDFSTETLKGRRTWNGVFQALRKRIQPILFYPRKPLFITEGEINKCSTISKN